MVGQSGQIMSCLCHTSLVKTLLGNRSFWSCPGRATWTQHKQLLSFVCAFNLKYGSASLCTAWDIWPHCYSH